MSAIMHVGAGFIAGLLFLLVYMVYRMMKNDGWDDSNMTNALRLLSHVVLHPHDFGKMYYVLPDDNGNRCICGQPFWYVDKDELSEVVETRP